jgi:hypothetical protein
MVTAWKRGAGPRVQASAPLSRCSTLPMKLRRLPALLQLIAAGVASAQRWGRQGSGVEEVRMPRGSSR